MIGMYNSRSLAQLAAYSGMQTEYSNSSSLSELRSSIKFDLGSDFSEWYDKSATKILTPKLPFDNCFFAYSCGHDGLSYGVHLRYVDDSIVGSFLYAEKDYKSYAPTPTSCYENNGELVVRLDPTDSYSPDFDFDTKEMQNCRIALTGVLKAIEALNCSNIVTVEHVPTRLKANRAAKKGKTLFRYHTLHITSGPKTKGMSLGGTHASPRAHLRRGHVRKLPNGSTTWVQPCVVGDKSKGIVHKDYLFTKES